MNFEKGRDYDSYLLKTYHSGKYQLQKIKRTTMKISAKAQKFFADVIEMLEFRPKFQVTTKNVIAECVEVHLNKEEFERFH